MENFTTAIRSIASDQNEFRRERLLKVLSAATFLIFFQAYMVAPLIPRLSIAFGISAQQIGLIVPAYLIPYGVSTLVYGVLSDRIGRRTIIFASLAAFIILTGLTATANSAGQLMLWRLLTGIGASPVLCLWRWRRWEPCFPTSNADARSAGYLVRWQAGQHSARLWG
jgi:MFS family permease